MKKSMLPGDIGREPGRFSPIPQMLLVLGIVSAGFALILLASCERTAETPSANAGTVYTCSMHLEILAKEPGKCPKCGMDLIEKKEPSAADPGAGQVVYTCSMHPDIKVNEPGKCPKCGMDLIQEKEKQP